MRPLISVIIPVYGVEKYLQRAVDSVLNQTYTNLDIILVDDGSKDGCPAICDRYAGTQARVRVIHKENGGLSDARNAGIAVAGGDYIAFLDSDDYYAPFFIELLYEQLSQNQADVAVCTYEVTEEMSVEKGPDFEQARQRLRQGGALVSVFDRQQMLLNQYDAICEDATYFIVAWNKLYKASLWKDIRFPKGKIHEDEATIYKVLDRIQKGVYLKLPLYAYFSAPESITRERFNLKRLDWLDALSDRIDYFREKHNAEIVRAALRARADGAIRYYAPLKKNEPQAVEQRKQLRRYVRETICTSRKGNPQERGFLGLKTRLGYRIFLLMPKLYDMLMKVGK